MAKRLKTEFTPIFNENQQKSCWKNLKEMNVQERHEIFSNIKDGVFPFIRNLGNKKKSVQYLYERCNFWHIKTIGFRSSD